MMIEAVLFDMDGVLLDSEEFITKAGILLFKEKGYKVDPVDFKDFTGMGEDRFLGGVAEKYNISFDVSVDKARAYEIYREIVRGKLKPLPGVEEFIGKCKKQGLKIAIATSADKIKMETNLAEIRLPVDLFDASVNGLEVEKKKPDPEIFLKAAGKLNVSPENCLVVEDAISGVNAAKSASCKCLALTTSFSKNELKLADWIAEDLSKAPSECLLW
jgi:HAD superfamily hydrolase (TIGR01509 family)